MYVVVRGIIYIAMVLFGIVSMWTTYVSLHDSILPTPEVRIHLGPDVVWDCAVFALGLSVAIGLMLFALKLAIIDEQKRLNFFGLAGMTVIAFISIAFNLDVLYRISDRDFFIRYSTERMRSVYEDYLQQAQTKLISKREVLMKQVAKQEGELDAEVRGLRQAPQGYGKIARKEDYELTLLQKTSEVELISVKEALAKKDEADTLLRSSLPQTLDDVEQMQSDLRVVLKDMGAVSDMPMPAYVKLENPLFAVFSKVFNYHTIGMKEVFLLLVAFLLDLGDIIGYSLIPNRPKKAVAQEPATVPDFRGPELVMRAALNGGTADPPLSLTDEHAALPASRERPGSEGIDPTDPFYDFPRR